MLALRQRRKDKNIKRKGKRKHTECTSIELYNALQEAWGFMAPNFILFDIRSRQEYEQRHIISAINLDCTTLLDTNMNAKNITFQDLSSSKGMKDSHLKSKNIYIYTDDTTEVEKKSNDDNTPQMDIVRSLLQNTANISSFHALKVPFGSFRAKYTFLCAATKDESESPVDSYPNEVIDDKLFVGDGMHAARLDVMQQLKITHIINVTDTTPNHFMDHKEVKISYLNIKIDDAKVNIGQFFDECNAFIDKALDKENGRVLVHCMMGVSRSASIVIAYVMYKYKYSFQNAHQYVKQHRSCICPNQSFEYQLQEYEKTILNSNDDYDEAKSDRT